MEAKAPSPVPGDQRTRPLANLIRDPGPLIPRTRDARRSKEGTRPYEAVRSERTHLGRHPVGFAGAITLFV